MVQHAGARNSLAASALQLLFLNRSLLACDEQIQLPASKDSF
jgi:hypothetical protein